MEDLSREERLGKKLLKIYGLKWAESPFRGIDVTLKKSFPYHAPDWAVLLLGNCICSSLNGLLRYIEEPVSLIEYASLDELDIQLTLLGMNG